MSLMFRRNLAAATLMFMPGCSTTPGLLEKSPEVFDSAKAPQALVICLSETWTNRNKDVRVNPMPDGQRVLINNPVLHAPIAIVEVREKGVGAEARFWKTTGPTGWTRDDLQSCL